MKKYMLFVLGMVVAAVLFTQMSVSAATFKPTLTFNESYTQKSYCYWLWENKFCDVTMDKGTFSVKAKVSMNGIDISKFNKETKFGIMVGLFYFEGTLGDDWLYQPGKTSFNIAYVDTMEDTGKKIKYVQLKLKWDYKYLYVTLTGIAPDFIDPIIADAYLWENTQIISDPDVPAYIELGDLYAGFYENVTGRVATTTRYVKGNENGTSIVKVKGKGTVTTEDFRELPPEELITRIKGYNLH